MTKDVELSIEKDISSTPLILENTIIKKYTKSMLIVRILTDLDVKTR